MVTTAKYTNIARSASIAVYEESGLHAIIVQKNQEEDNKPYEIFQRIKTFYNQDRGEKSILEKLKKAFLSVKTPELEIALAVVADNVLYGLCYNGAGLLLNRADKLHPLIKTAEGERLTVSGFMKPGDTFFMATHEVFSVVPMSDIEESLSLESLEKAIEKISNQSNLDEGNSALLLLGVVEEDLPVVSRIENKDEKIDTTKKTTGLKNRAVGLIDKALNVLPDKSIVVKENDYAFRTKRKNRTASLVGVLLLALLGVSIYFGIRAGRVREVKEEYEPRLERAEQNLTEAKNLVDLSPSRAQELILEAETIVEDLQSIEIEDERIDQLAKEINESLGPIAGIYKPQAELYLDLSLVSSGFGGDKLALSGNEIRVLDAESRKLVGIELETKRTEIISGPDYISNSIDTFAYEDRSFIISSDGIREVTDEVELVIKSNWDSSNIIAQAFAGNIYILDKNEGRIYRHSGVRGGFLDSEDWLGEGIEPDFSDTISMMIDGSIWILYQDGNLEQYSLGVPVRFSINGMKGSFDNPRDMFTKDESEYVYVLDPNNKRVVILNKGGQYLGEYVSDMLSDATELVVAEGDRKIIFLANDKLYFMELKHEISQPEEE